MFCTSTDQLSQIKQITHAKVLCSVLKDDYGDISYQARLFKRQHSRRLVVMKNMRVKKILKKMISSFLFNSLHIDKKAIEYITIVLKYLTSFNKYCSW